MGDISKCLYGSEKVTAPLCEAYDDNKQAVLYGRELALDFICVDGYSGIISRLLCSAYSTFPHMHIFYLTAVTKILSVVCYC